MKSGAKPTNPVVIAAAIQKGVLSMKKLFKGLVKLTGTAAVFAAAGAGVYAFLKKYVTIEQGTENEPQPDPETSDSAEEEKPAPSRKYVNIVLDWDQVKEDAASLVGAGKSEEEAEEEKNGETCGCASEGECSCQKEESGEETSEKADASEADVSEGESEKAADTEAEDTASEEPEAAEESAPAEAASEPEEKVDSSIHLD